MKRLLIIPFLLVAFNASAFTIQTARGNIEVKSGDVLKYNSMWTGQVDCKGEGNITFKGWNFSRKVPHTIVFVNCHDLTFINGNLNNVELQDDFTTKGALTIHQEIKTVGNEQHHIVERGDGKTVTYKVVEIQVDLVEDEFPLLSLEQKNRLRAKYDEEGITHQFTQKEEQFLSIKDTPNDKKIKGIRIHPNTGLPR